MLELYEAAFSGLNVVYTVLLLMVLLYWGVVILGVADFNLFDFDLATGDVDGDFDVDGAGETVGGSSWLGYFNIGDVPIMIYVSIVVLVVWVVSIQTNHWLDSVRTEWVQAHRSWIAAGLAVPNFLFGMHVAKFLMLPVKRLKRERPIVANYDGQICLVRSLEVNEKYGQVEIPTDESPILLNARTRGGEELRKGDAAVILETVTHNGQDCFVVTKHT